MGLTNILITGVTGFLGQALVAALHDRNELRLYGHSRDVSTARSVLEGYNIQILDGIGAAKLDEIRIQIIIHLAGIAHDLSNKYLPEDYFAINDQATRVLYDEFLESQATSFIFLSSIKAAIDTASSPASEEITPAPVSPYGQSKLNAEQYIQKQSIEEKNYYILRPCMVHGPGNKGNLNLLYKYVKTGLPFPLGSFKNRRSFLSVDNFVFVILELIKEKAPSGIYHLADDGSLSTADLFRIIAGAIGKPSRVLNVPAAIMKAGFRLLSRERMLDKLTDDMIVSNQKIKQYLDGPLPVTMEQGLIKTIRSFDAKR